MIWPATTAEQRRVAGRFLLAMAAGNLLWEIAQMPLYTIWLTGTGSEIAYAALHCTLGDILIAGTCLLLAILLFGRNGWPLRGFRRAALAMMAMALGYTVFSEWLNTQVLRSWAYADAMPRLPWLGTGLSPVLQWIVVPTLAFRLSRRAP